MAGAAKSFGSMTMKGNWPGLSPGCGWPTRGAATGTRAGACARRAGSLCDVSNSVRGAIALAHEVINRRTQPLRFHAQLLAALALEQDKTTERDTGNNERNARKNMSNQPIANPYFEPECTHTARTLNISLQQSCLTRDGCNFFATHSDARHYPFRGQEILPSYATTEPISSRP